ncbi:MAG: DUF2924 domain-containing protein [Pseudomonadota bacterium]|nr:DUF2924 domain-containing protein [Pseudomonadota bacterium]
MACRKRSVDIDPDGLVDQPRSALVDLWHEAFETKPPRGLSQAFLARLLAYDLQVQARGGLSPRLVKRLQATAAGETPSPAAPQLRPGAQLLRTWNGVTHRVDVVEDGYRYRGDIYRSLSAIAKRITGAHWSGPRFFGLVSRSKAA